MRLVARSDATIANIKTARLSYRVTSTGSVKKGLTADDCEKLMSQFDLVNHPENLRDLIVKLFGGAFELSEHPWTNSELLTDGERLFVSRSNRTDERTDKHLTDVDKWIRLPNEWNGLGGGTT